MSYDLLYTDKALGHLDALPAYFTDTLEHHLVRLSDAPATLSVAIASPPFPPRGQLYHFEADDAKGTSWFFTIIFRYAQDERALHILSVTWRELIEE